MSSSRIPTDGPETALGHAVRRLRVRHSRTFVARAVASHPQPSSLLALVEVARDLGLEVTPGRAEPSALADIASPAVVHFDGPGGGGFGVLERVVPEGFEVWDSVNGSRRIPRAEFLAHWTGVIAVLTRGEGRQTREPRYLRNRVTELVFSGYDPPALVGNRHARSLRVALVALVGALLLVSVGRLDETSIVPATVLTLLAAVGLGVTMLAGISIGGQESGLSDRICARGRFVDCQSVLSSRYSRVLGIPLTDVGIAFFGALLLLAAAGALASTDASWTAMAWLFTLSVPFSVTLIGIQIAMRQLCTLCIAVHVVNIGATLVAWLWWGPEARAADLFPALLFSGLSFFLMLFLVVPYFRKHQGMRVLVGMRDRIAGSPFTSLAELLSETPAGLVANEVAVALPDEGAAHEMVVLVHPSCNKCDAVLQQVVGLVQAGLVRAHVGLAPKEGENDQRMCSAVSAAGVARGGGGLLAAYGIVKQKMREMLAGNPVTTLAGSLDVPEAELSGSLAKAERMTAAAAALVDSAADGTPAIFFDGRLFRGDLGHLGWLLEHHPELLEPTRNLEREASHT